MQRKLHIKKGDIVIVNTGEYKGQQGRVLEFDKKTSRAIVEGVNMVSKHTKPNAANPQGGIIKKEAPVHISNLNPVDPSARGFTPGHCKLFQWNNYSSDRWSNALFIGMWLAPLQRSGRHELTKHQHLWHSAKLLHCNNQGSFDARTCR